MSTTGKAPKRALEAFLIERGFALQEVNTVTRVLRYEEALLAIVRVAAGSLLEQLLVQARCGRGRAWAQALPHHLRLSLALAKAREGAVPGTAPVL